MDKKLVKEMSIRRVEVEKFIVAVQQIFLPIKLSKKTQIVIDYDPEYPSIKIRFFEME